MCIQYHDLQVHSVNPQYTARIEPVTISAAEAIHGCELAKSIDVAATLQTVLSATAYPPSIAAISCAQYIIQQTPAHYFSECVRPLKQCCRGCCNRLRCYFRWREAGVTTAAACSCSIALLAVQWSSVHMLKWYKYS
jgi:hypothetical protein